MSKHLDTLSMSKERAVELGQALIAYGKQKGLDDSIDSTEIVVFGHRVTIQYDALDCGIVNADIEQLDRD